jgi:uncharacterized protein YbjT (DUF2867 family)
MVVVSIIGTDRFTAGYGVAKIAHEQAMLSGPIPAQVLRAAQFHELVAQLVEWGRQGEVSYVPKMRTQLVAARTVAQALADMATGPGPAPAPGSAGTPIPEIAGPRGAESPRQLGREGYLAPLFNDHEPASSACRPVRNIR